MKAFGKTLLALSVTGLLAAGAQAQDKDLHVYSWSDYIAEGPDGTVAQFEKETGIKVTYDTYDSNESLEAKLFAGKSGYDIVVPSNSFYARQVKAGIYTKLDKSKIPNWDNQDPAMLKLFGGSGDEGNQYGAPYMWGTLGIGYNPDLIKAALGDNAPVNSWDLVFKVENIEKLKSCGVAFLDSPTEVLPAALHYLGFNPHSIDKKELQAAEELMLKIRPYITYFHSSRYINDIADGNLCVMATAYSGDIAIARERAEEAGGKVKIEYNVPKEGSGAFFDVLAIPADAPHKDAAHAWINFNLKPEIAAANTNAVFFSNINTKATEFVDEAIRNDPGTYPPAEIMAKIYTIRADYPDSALRTMTRSWTKIKSGR